MFTGYYAGPKQDVTASTVFRFSGYGLQSLPAPVLHFALVESHGGD
jgi:hypothetical protein